MEEEKGISLSDIFRVLKKNVILIAIIVLSVILLGGVYTFGIAKAKYKSSTTLIVAVKNIQNPENPTLDPNSSAKYMYTVRDLVMEDIVLGEVAREKGISAGTLRSMVSIKTVEYSFLMTISVTAENPKDAVELANALADQLIETAADNNTLKWWLEGSIDITSRANKAGYASPNKVMYMMIFTLLGIVLSCVVVFVIEFASNKYRNKKDIEQEIPEKILGTFTYKKVGKNGLDDDGSKLVSLVDPTIKGFEQYNKLLSNIKYSNLDTPYKVIASVSTNPNELKSTISANLAYCMAHNNKKVILIDLDLRKPILNKTFKVSQENGIIDYLDGSITKEDLIKHSEVGVDIITPGHRILNPMAVLESVKLQELIYELRGEYDYIVIDSAPLLACADSLTVAKMCDLVIFNIGLKTSKKSEIKEALSSLKSVGVKNIGINVTKIPQDKNRDYYYGD